MNQEETFSLKHILFKTQVKDNICQVLIFFFVKATFFFQLNFKYKGIG